MGDILLIDGLSRIRPTSQVNPVIDPAVTAQVMSHLRSAHRLILDDEGSRRLGNLVSEIPELIVREHEFARAPFDRLWVELSLGPYIEELSALRGPEESRDNRIGYFVDHGSVYTFASDIGSHSIMLPFIYDLHSPWELRDQLEICDLVRIPRGALDGIMWGTTSEKLSKEELRVLRASHSIRMAPLRVDYDIPQWSNLRTQLGETLYHSSGDLRTVIALLLVLNRPSLTRYVRETPSRRTFHRGRSVNYMSHTTITIPINPVPTIRLVGTPGGESTHRRRHEVRGHYCHDALARAGSARHCVHDWAIDDTRGDELPENWTCKKCGGRRWWRRSHERGSAEVGFSLSDEYRLA